MQKEGGPVGWDLIKAQTIQNYSEQIFHGIEVQLMMQSAKADLGLEVPGEHVEKAAADLVNKRLQMKQQQQQQG